MPTREQREQMEEELGRRWKELAASEGHVAAVPKRFVGAENDSDARADTLLRLMRKRPGATMRTLSAQLNTTIDDTRRRMANLIRRGDVRYVNQKYEVTK